MLKRGFEGALMQMHVPEGVKPDDTTLAIQRESLRQLDVFFQRLEG